MREGALNYNLFQMEFSRKKRLTPWHQRELHVPRERNTANMRGYPILNPKRSHEFSEDKSGLVWVHAFALGTDCGILMGHSSGSTNSIVILRCPVATLDCVSQQATHKQRELWGQRKLSLF